MPSLFTETSLPYSDAEDAILSTSIPPANSSTNATFSYGNDNRLASVSGSPTAASFVYDAFGQRFSKTDTSSPAMIYAYGQDQRLIEENNNGVITDYVYADGRPISDIKSGGGGLAQINYVTADRLGTPQLVTSSSTSSVWATTYQPYGTTGTITGTATQNLRLPGQNYDSETGFYYNLQRDYMPDIGRYLEADPIGLAGGLNTYSYVGGNPMSGIDPHGLWTINIGISLNFNIPLYGPVGIGGGGFVGIAFDGSTVAIYDGGGGGAGSGAGGSLAIQFGASNASSVCDLSGLFGTASISGGEGLIVGGEGYSGYGSQGQSVTGGNIVIGGGGGTPASGTVGVTQTYVHPF